MATSAFKSTTKRSSIGATADSQTCSTVKRSEDHGSSNGHRRSRSLSRVAGRFSGFSEIDNEETGDSKGKFVNTVRGSGFPDISLDDLANELFAMRAEVEERESARGRVLRRSSGVGPLDVGAEAAAIHRRGRSVSRHQASAEKGFVDNGRRRSVSRHPVPAEKGFVDTGRRKRSVSIARDQCSNSESNQDHSHNFINHAKTKSTSDGNSQKTSLDKPMASTTFPNNQCGLRRSMSQKDLSQQNDGYSSYTSALTDDEGHSARCNKNVNEKTIRAVYAQKTTDHPTDDGVGSGLFEEMRKEVRHAVAEIRTELEQVWVQTKPAMLGNSDCLESNSTDVIEAIAKIRKNYTTKLEESEKRTRDLLAQLAIEEQRGREFSKIVRELLPEPKQSVEPGKSSRTRKRSTDRTRISKRLTEEAEKYFEGFLSNVEDMEFSSFDGETSDASSTFGGNARTRDRLMDKTVQVSAQVPRDPASASPLPVDADGVVLPWLKWETSNDSSLLPHMSNMETPMTSRKGISDTAQGAASPWVGSGFSKSNCPASSQGSSNPNDDYDPYTTFETNGFSSGHRTVSNSGGAETCLKHSAAGDSGEVFQPFEMDEYLQHLHSEDLLIERMKQRHRINFGGIILCSRALI